VDRRPVRQRPPVLGRGRRDRIEAPLQCGVVKIVRQRPTDPGFARPAQARSGGGRPIPILAAIWRLDRPAADSRSTSRILRIGNLCWAIPPPLEKERSPADSQITQRRSSRPTTALLPWSPSTGTGGRHGPARADETGLQALPFRRCPYSRQPLRLGWAAFGVSCRWKSTVIGDLGDLHDRAIRRPAAPLAGQERARITAEQLRAAQKASALAWRGKHLGPRGPYKVRHRAASAA
jgi:hypothetical protein